MRHAVAAMLAGTAMASCALVVSLDDLSGGSDASSDAPVGVDAADAQNTPDTGKDVITDVVGGDEVGPPPSYSATILADGPLAYFHLDEISGTALMDSSGNKHDATLVNGIALGGGGAFASSGTSVHFNGLGYISIDDSVNSNGTPFDFVGKAQFTLEAWVSIDSQPISANGGFTIFSKEQYLGNSNYLGYDLYTAPPFAFQREDEPTDETEADSTNGFAALDTWYYLVGTYDGNALTIYIDDVVVASFLGSQTSLPITNAPFLFGSETTTYGSPLVGKMDEVAIYAKALTPAQIAAHFHAAGK